MNDNVVDEGWDDHPQPHRQSAAVPASAPVAVAVSPAAFPDSSEMATNVNIMSMIKPCIYRLTLCLDRRSDIRPATGL